jgi:hypothetical protein
MAASENIGASETKTNFLAKLNHIKSGLESMKLNIINNYNLIQENRKRDLKINSDIVNVKEERKKYDTMFEEEETKIQTSGGKSRKQTLQEFVLLFFYVSFILLIVSLGAFYAIQTQSTPQTVKIVLLLLGILLTVSSLIFKYA